jgi:hypothetical protein
LLLVWLNSTLKAIGRFSPPPPSPHELWSWFVLQCPLWASWMKSKGEMWRVN